MREDLCQQCPRHRTQRHRIDRDSRHHQRHHQESRHTHIIASAQDQVDKPQTACSYQHQCPASPLLNGIKGYKSEDHIGDTGNDDVDEHPIHIKACTYKDLLGIVEDDIRAAPLLENGNHKAEQQHMAVFLRGER